MDILNFIYWIRNRRVVTSVPDDALIPVGIPDVRRDDKYLTVAVKKSDLISTCPVELSFKEGSVGPKVSFKKVSGSNAKDVIIPGRLEITRGNNGGGIYNVALENNYNSSISPENTTWNTQYIDPANVNWAQLWNIENRTYDTWRKASETPEGNYAPPQYVGMPAIMRYYDGFSTPRYWLIMFTEWGVGAFNEEGAFAYDRWEIYPSVTFTRADYTNTVDILSPEVHIGRNSNGGPIYNVLDEPYSEVGVSPRKTKWNSVYTDNRAGYNGFSDLSNLESRVYTDFALALDYSIGNNVLDTELIMWDLTTDLYYKVTFSDWTQSGNGGGFIYTRTVIPQSCNVKFADGSILNTAPAAATDCCPFNDGQDNLVIVDNSDLLVNVGPGSTHLIDNFSGMLIVNDHYDGRVETWIAGGGDGVLLGYTNVGSGPCSSTLTMISNGYEWTNVDNMTGPFTFTVIKTRQGA